MLFEEVPRDTFMMVRKGRGNMAEVYSLNSITRTPSHSEEQSSPPLGWALHFRNLELSSRRASAVLKLCRIQGKSVPGQSLCTYPSGSFQLCVGSMSTSFVRETESSSAKVLFTVSR